MKTRKKLLSVLLAVLLLNVTMAFAAIPASAYVSGNCGEDVIWEYEADTGELVISGTGPMYDYFPGASTSPFKGMSDLKSVRIESGVTTVGAYAFQGCANLKEVALPESMETIGAHAFQNCGLLTLVLPKGVQFLGEFSFAGCSSLKEVTFYAGIEIIGNSAFWKCNQIKTVRFYGNEAQWNQITIEEYNTYFKDYTTRIYLITVTAIAAPGGQIDGNDRIVSVVSPGELIEFVAEPDEGYTFDGWYNGDTLVCENETYDLNPEEDMILTAYFNEIGSEDPGTTDPSDPTEPQPDPNMCHWRGKVHEGFFQKIIGFFHNILASIFGAKY